MKIGIIGAGIAGLTLARLLEKFDIPYELFEERATLPIHGSGIILSPNAFPILEELGELKNLSEIGQNISSLEYADELLKPIFKINPERLKLNPKYSLMSLKNIHFLELLLKGIPAHKIHFNSKLMNISKRLDKTLVQFAHGDSADYDLVVAADGLHSTIRSMLYPYLRPEFVGLSSWHFKTSLEHYPMSREIAFELMGKGKKISIAGLKENAWSWSIMAASLPSQVLDRDHLRQTLKELFNGYDKTVLKLIEQSSMEEVYKYDLYELPPLILNETGRVVFIGDSAHSLPSFLHQGVAQAMEDSWYLAKTVMLTKDLDQSLKEYNKIRKKRIQFIYGTSTFLEDIGQFHGRALKKAGHHMMRFVPAMAYDQMLKKIYKIKL